MVVLTAEQIKDWDQYTLMHEPIASLDLMERAALRCVQWLEKKGWQKRKIHLYCGKGNNGGDGLAIARMLHILGYHVFVYIINTGKVDTPDFEKNLKRLKESINPVFIEGVTDLIQHSPNDIILDAIVGLGLNNPLKGLHAEVVNHINNFSATVVAIDVPSGLFLDKPSLGIVVIQANYTLSFQCFKLGLLLPENASFFGDVSILDIGLHPSYLDNITPVAEMLDNTMAGKLYQPRHRFSHKGTFGHALMVAGSLGKMGAAVLAIKACLRSGAGLTTALVPKCGYSIIQLAAPEAMALSDVQEEYISGLPVDIEKYSSVGIGPGLGLHEDTQKLFSYIIKRFKKPIVIDADGLNILSEQKELFTLLQPQTILTPHPKEFERLFGKCENDFERLELLKQKATAYNIIIILKSHHTMIAMPGGKVYFNTTGNAGLAKGGSGDVLTGIITSLMAQQYVPAEAALLGVYLHGKAADLANISIVVESMIAGDVIEYLPAAFSSLQKEKSLF